MSNFWDQVKSIFQNAGPDPQHQPSVHEVLERDEAFQEKLQRWQQSLVCRRFFDWLRDQYATFQATQKAQDRALTFLNTPSAKGFVVFLSLTGYTKSDAEYMLETLQQRVRLLHYRQQLADLQLHNEEKWVATHQRYYLKPRQELDLDKKLNQRFGNITIDLHLRNDEPYQLKFRAVGYTDHLFEEVQPFGELMQAVTE